MENGFWTALLLPAAKLMSWLRGKNPTPSQRDITFGDANTFADNSISVSAGGDINLNVTVVTPPDTSSSSDVLQEALHKFPSDAVVAFHQYHGRKLICGTQAGIIEIPLRGGTINNQSETVNAVIAALTRNGVLVPLEDADVKSVNVT